MPAPISSFSNAVSAYANTAAAGKTGGLEARDSKGGDEFADLVKGAIDQAIKIGRTSEKLSIAAVNDRADLNQVVTAVAEAELTLQTVVAVRDKVIDAYKEIIRMPI